MTISCTDGSLGRVGGRFSIGTATATARGFRDLGRGMDRRTAGIRGSYAINAPDPDLPCPRRGRRARGGCAVARRCPAARAWLTTGDRASLLAEQPAAALGAP